MKCRFWESKELKELRESVAYLKKENERLKRDLKIVDMSRCAAIQDVMELKEQLRVQKEFARIR